MGILHFRRARAARQSAGLGLSLGLAGAALLLLGRWVGVAEGAARPIAPNGPSIVIFVVTTTVDSPDSLLTDGLCKDTFDGGCSLRAATQQLNHDSGGTILLGPGPFNLTNDGLGDLQLQKDIALVGGGPATSIIQGNPAGWAHRILRVQNGANVIFSSIGISGGHPINGAVGGGIDVVSGTLRLINASVLNNQAAQGGGIYNRGRLDVLASTIRGNQAYTDGGGVYNEAFSAGQNFTLTSSLVQSNTAGDAGGGIFTVGNLAVYSSTLEHNQAGFGGGIYNSLLGPGDVGYLWLEDSTVSQNHAGLGYGGGVANNAPQASAFIINSTLDGNTADHSGGGLGGTGHVTLSNDTVTGNVADVSHLGSGDGGGLFADAAAIFNVDNSLVALNVDNGGEAPDCAGAIGSLHGHNLVQSTLGCLLTGGTTTGNVTGLDPRLFPLGNYGGPTATRALRLDSPAIDAAVTICAFGHSALASDQRGRLRQADGDGDGVAGCDIGAYELQLARLFLPALAR